MSHKYAVGQTLTCEWEGAGRVEVARQLDERCEPHGALCYGCIAEGDRHYTFCEESLAPLTTTQKRKLN